MREAPAVARTYNSTQKQENTFRFTVVNCLKLKDNPTRSHNHLVQLDTIITEASERGLFNFMPLKAVETTFEECLRRSSHTDSASQARFKNEVEAARTRCQTLKILEGEQGRIVVLLLLYGEGFTMVPVFVSDIMLALIETRVDWQEHKYRLLVNS